MSSRDPYGTLPNLAGASGRLEDIRSGGDPSRFFPSALGDSEDAVTGRILNVPRACAFFDSAVNATTSGVTWTIIWEDTDYDNNHMWDAANPTRLTARSPGLYGFWCQIAWTSNAFGDRDMYFLKNGSAPFGTTYSPTTTTFPHFMQASCPQPMDTGDYVEVLCLQNSAVGVSLHGALGNNGFQAVRLSTFGSDNG